MAIYIVYPSALEYWLEEKGFPSGIKDYMEKEIISRPSIRRAIRKMNFNKPVYIAIPRNKYRTNEPQILFRSIPKRLPKNSFISVMDSVYICSPEMCFLQAAMELPIHKLVQLANNLCAKFVLDSYEEYWQRKREPVTSVESIREYLEHAKSTSGCNQAMIAIKYALDNSNSPMETNLATVAMLPWRYGGYNLKAPRLNLDVKLSDTGAEHLGRDTCCCDMVWEKEKVVLEYDSNLTHLSPLQHARDKRRITALSLSGYQVISVTAEDVRSFRAVEELFLRVRKALGMQTNAERVKKNFEKRYEVVRDIMFSKN